jgi:hypothetical protein
MPRHGGGTAESKTGLNNSRQKVKDEDAPGGLRVK